jgi:hypothetical protein
MQKHGGKQTYLEGLVEKAADGVRLIFLKLLRTEPTGYDDDAALKAHFTHRADQSQAVQVGHVHITDDSSEASLMSFVLHEGINSMQGRYHVKTVILQADFQQLLKGRIIVRAQDAEKGIIQGSHARFFRPHNLTIVRCLVKPVPG